MFNEESENFKLEDVLETDLGLVEEIKITKDDTLILGGKGTKESIQARCEEIQFNIDSSDSQYEQEKLSERKARLGDGIASIRVGGLSEVEMGEKKDRVTDALCATRCAVEEGIVPGGGCALWAWFEKVGKTYQISGKRPKMACFF